MYDYILCQYIYSWTVNDTLKLLCYTLLQNGMCALVSASKHGHVEIVRLLSQHGAQVNLKKKVTVMRVTFYCNVTCLNIVSGALLYPWFSARNGKFQFRPNIGQRFAYHYKGHEKRSSMVQISAPQHLQVRSCEGGKKFDQNALL